MQLVNSILKIDKKDLCTAGIKDWTNMYVIFMRFSINREKVYSKRQG